MEDQDAIIGTFTIVAVIVCGIINMVWVYFRTSQPEDDDFSALRDVV